jgi:D-sedoheptulose 7-phosphate isomerase
MTGAFDAALLSVAARAHQVFELHTDLSGRYGDLLVDCAYQMAARFSAGGRLLSFGNGGGASDAQQLAASFLCPSGDARPLPAICLASDAAVITALANDMGADLMFARQLVAIGQPEDIAVGLSASGSPASLQQAFLAAGRRGMLTVGIAGHDGGQLAKSGGLDYLFVAPPAPADQIAAARATICHVLWELTVTATSEA